MGIWLVMQTETGERPFPIRKSRTLIGSEATSDVRIAVPSVAPRHCELTMDDDGLHVADLGTMSGTYHNGETIERAALAADDQLTVGPVTFHVRVETDESAPRAGASLETKLEHRLEAQLRSKLERELSRSLERNAIDRTANGRDRAAGD